MTRAFAVLGLVLVLAALTAGCGDDDGVRTGGAGTGGGLQPVPAGIDPLDVVEADCDPESGAASAADLDVAVYADPLVRGELARWHLVVTNNGDDDAALVFFSGQKGDVVLAREGDEVYRWSAGRVFTQAIGCSTLPAGASAMVTLAGAPIDLEPGRYRLEATLTSRPTPEPTALDVEVEPAGDGR